MEKGLITLFEDYLFKNDPGSSVHYDTFISLFVKLAKDPCEEKVKFIVSLLKQNSSDGALTASNVIEVSVFLCYDAILQPDIEVRVSCAHGLFGGHDWTWLFH
jgi:hypothetical protein